MQKPRYEFYSSLNQRLIDVLVAGGAFYLAYQLRFDWKVDAFSAYQMWLLLFAIMAGRVAVNNAAGIYRLIWRFVSLSDAITVARSYALFSAMLLITRLVFPASLALLRIPVSIILIEFLVSLTGALGVRALRRVLYEKFSGSSRTLRRKKQVLLIGAGHAGVMVTKELALHSDIKPVGFLDDDPRKIGRVIGGLSVLGPVSTLAAVVEQYGVEEVIICIARAPRGLLKRLWVLCEQLAVPTMIVPTFEEILQGKVNIAAFRNVEMSDLLGRETIQPTFTEGEVVSSYRGKRILVTGAGGSIGSELAYQLTKLHPSELILFDKDENGLNDARLRIGTHNGQTAVRAVVGDLRFPERLEAVFSSFRPEVVFHAAAHKHVYLMEANPCEAILNNVVGTRNLLVQSVAFGISRFVLISTDKAVKPTSIMGASKRICEMLVQSYQSCDGPRFCAVRFGNVIGSRGSVVPIFKNQIARGEPITLTHPEVRRYLMTIPEAVYLLIHAGALASSGETFVLEMGEPVPILNLAQDLIELSGLRPGRDVQIEITGLHSGEKLTEVLFDEDKERLLPTRFDKVRLVDGVPFEQDGFRRKVPGLVEAAFRQDGHEVYRMLRKFDISFQGEPISEPVGDAAEFAPANVAPTPQVA